jgi:hypothetical protein
VGLLVVVWFETLTLPSPCTPDFVVLIASNLTYIEIKSKQNDDRTSRELLSPHHKLAVWNINAFLKRSG